MMIISSQEQKQKKKKLCCHPQEEFQQKAPQKLPGALEYVTDSGGFKSPQLLIFKVAWCPSCLMAKPNKLSGF